MSKPKVLQQEKEQQQRPESPEGFVKIAKRLTAKEKRNLEVTGGKKSKSNILVWNNLYLITRFYLLLQ